jgi:hypothetical protein
MAMSVSKLWRIKGKFVGEIGAPAAGPVAEFVVENTPEAAISRLRSELDPFLVLSVRLVSSTVYYP